MSNLTKLFRWTKKVDILGSDNKGIVATVYIKLINDTAYQEARVVALKASKELRSKLRDTASDEYAANFQDLNELDVDELIIGITMGEISDYRDEGILVLKSEEYPELVDNPTLEQQEEHEKAINDIKDKRVKALTEFMEKRSTERKEELIKMPIEDLRKRYKASLGNIRTSDEFSRVFRDYQIFRGTYTDPEFKTVAFASFKEYNECSPLLKNQLVTAYTSLEISGEDLKN